MSKKKKEFQGNDYKMSVNDGGDEVTVWIDIPGMKDSKKHNVVARIVNDGENWSIAETFPFPVDIKHGIKYANAMLRALSEIPNGNEKIVRPKK